VEGVSDDALEFVKQQQEAAELFKVTDWTSRDSMVKLFPLYVQEQYRIRKENIKGINNSVNIESFTMKTPFGDRELLTRTELVIEQGKRQCLYGANSTGKTLLFANMYSRKIKDFPKHIYVHHCKEFESHELSDTVLNTVLNSHPYRNILLKCEARLKELIADPAVNAETKDAYQNNLDYVKMQKNSIKADDAEDRVTKMLRVLGFDEVGQARTVQSCSGGLRMRVALAMAFFVDADLLLLDEPTNHLDFPSVLWLENRLRGYRGSFLLVSHDRELLNNVCTAVMMIEDRQIKYYPCGFKEFEKRKAADDKKSYEEIEKFLARNRNADPSTMLGRQCHDKREWSHQYFAKQVALAGKFTFPTATKLINKEKNADGTAIAEEDISLINLQNVRFSYNPENNGHFIFNDPICFNVTATTRCGVMGPNGAGKSTLLKLLTHKLVPTQGSVVHHPNFTLAYFGQHSTAELDLEKTPMEFMQSQFPKENSGTLRNHLGKTSIVGTTADTRMHRLSFSQRSCIIFSKLTFVCPHLLIMDEPTNFLDLESVDSLISACNKYQGALLLVSHNRDFLRKCAKQFLSVVPGHFNMYSDLKTAERATYSFITEMEEGGKVGASALANNPGGGSVHASQKVGGAAVAASTVGADGVIRSTGAAPAAKPAAAGAAKPVTYAEGEKVEALWTDGKWYAAVIKKTGVTGGKFAVTYTAYGNTVTLAGTQIRKPVAPAAKPAAAAAGAKPAPKK